MSHTYNEDYGIPEYNLEKDLEEKKKKMSKLLDSYKYSCGISSYEAQILKEKAVEIEKLKIKLKEKEKEDTKKRINEIKSLLPL